MAHTTPEMIRARVGHIRDAILAKRPWVDEDHHAFVDLAALVEAFVSDVEASMTPIGLESFEPLRKACKK